MGFKTLEPGDAALERHARKCVALAQVARAWESAVDRARILRGRPLPGSLKPERAEPKPRQAMVRAYQPKRSVSPADKQPRESQ